MKKIAIVAALFALTTAATAQTTIYGRMNATIDNTKLGSVTSNGMVNDISHFGITVREDLGNGLSARAQVETGINSQNPNGGNDTQFGDRQSTVGLVHRMGSLDIGRNVHGVFSTLADGDPFGALYGSLVGDIHNLRGLRVSNGVFAKLSPLPGITAGMDRTHTVTGDEVSVFSANGKIGPVDAGIARYEQGKEKSLVASASMKFGNTKLFYSFSDNDGAQKFQGNMVGAAHKMGAYTAKASYGRTNKDITGWAVGAEYALSKRTDILVSYRNVDKIAIANDVKQIGLGIPHRF